MSLPPCRAGGHAHRGWGCIVAVLMQKLIVYNGTPLLIRATAELDGASPRLPARPGRLPHNYDLRLPSNDLHSLPSPLLYADSYTQPPTVMDGQ